MARRFAPSRRQLVAQQASPPMAARPKTFPAPIAGLVTADSMIASRPNSAQVLDNIFPMAQSARVRAGSRTWGTFGNAIVSMVSYNVQGGTKLFVATATALYDNTSSVNFNLLDEDNEELTDENDDPLTIDDPTPVISGQTGGYYSYVNFATAGGYFMPVANGVDPLLIYDGTAFYPVTDTAIRSLNFDGQTGDFTVGLTVTGGTSGATGVIVRVSDSGTTGTLYLNNVSGTFQDNETITDTSTGSALANGADAAFLGAITGVDTDALSHVNVYRNRMFFVEKDTLNVWYLPVNSITGAAGNITLAGIFGEGGSVLFTETWSMDAGDGLDDKFVVISTTGEAAVFQGSDPSDANDWSIVGRYKFTRPLGMRCTMRAGGELLIGTEEGLVPISMAVNKDPSQLSMASVSQAIEPTWATEAADRQSFNWEIAKWPRMNMALVTLPTNSEETTDWYCFVVNLETNAWARYTGWDTRCSIVYNDQLYFGTRDGRVVQAELGGDDDGAPYYPVCVYNWDALDALGYLKTVVQARATFVTGSDILPDLSASTDYAVSLPTKPNAPTVADTPSLWDVGRWDQAVWDGSTQRYTLSTRWVSIGRSGYSVAPQWQMTCSGDIQPTAEFVEMTIRYTMGELVV